MVMADVTEKGNALKYASDELKAEKEFVIAVVAQH
jgi:hypothetical protein